MNRSEAAFKRWADPAYRHRQVNAMRDAAANRYLDADRPVVPREALHLVERYDGIPAKLTHRWDATMARFGL